MSDKNYDFNDLIEFAKIYGSLSSSVQSQIQDLLDGDFEVNENAVNLIKKRLGGWSSELDEAIENFENKDE